MADTGVVLLAAFGGGLAGAVLQPVVEATFEAFRGRGQRKKRRQQRLRAMLEAQIRYGAKVLGRCALTVMYRQQSVPLPPSITRYGELKQQATELADSGFFWQPNRIEDSELRALAHDYEENCVHLMEREFHEEGISDGDFLSLRIRHSELRRELEARMDALDWPEVD